MFIENKNFFNHGNLEKWKNILNLLPESNSNFIDYASSQITLGEKSSLTPAEKKNLEDLLIKLSPWRKGPFNICGIDIDSEWQSNQKWERVKSFLPNIKGMRIGDIGCSNGYYLYKLLDFNPELVVGMDRTALYIIQFLATKYYAKKIQNLLTLPCSLEDYNPKIMDFDLILSMGILYHAKNPVENIDTTRKLIKQNGFLVLETIISNQGENINIKNNETYAGMKNIGTIFSKNNIINLLSASGFKNIELVNKSFTNTNEQRATRWMEGKSFKDFTLPSGYTIEGYPPVCRVIFIAQKK